MKIYMVKTYSIWTPVVIGRLKSPHRIKSEKLINIDKVYKSIEELKIKVKEYQLSKQGQALELSVRLDILCLLEDLLGSMHLTVKEEIVKEKIRLDDFDNYIDSNKDIKYIVNTIDVGTYGELNGEKIKVAFYLDVTVIATNEQIISLSLAEEIELEPENESLQAVLNKLQLEVQEIEAEKVELRRKLFIYERDISSLKKGLLKAENRNASLNKELEEYHKIVNQLREAIKDKELRLNRYENVYYSQDYAENYDTNSLGSRIKKMFMSN